MNFKYRTANEIYAMLQAKVDDEDAVYNIVRELYIMEDELEESNNLEKLAAFWKHTAKLW